MKKYVITEEQYEKLLDYCKTGIEMDILNKIYKQPLQQDIPTSKEIIALATNDFKNREERKGLHDQPSWVSGWITGFLSERKPEWYMVSINKVEKELLEYFDTGYPSDDCLTIKEVFERVRGKI
jgi:hypothetical protein